MTPEQLEAGLQKLNDLSLEEYHVPLSQVADLPGDEKLELQRLGRLIGVMMKEPFAKSVEESSPSPYTGAYRSWHLGPASDFQKPEAQSTWQYRTLEKLLEDSETGGAKYTSVYDMAADVQFERGFFALLTMSVRKYLCGDADLRAKIESEIESAKNSGLRLKNMTPEMIVASGGASLGTLLVENVDIFGYMGVPAIAGVTFIAYRIGMDTFCAWADGSLVSGPTEQ